MPKLRVSGHKLVTKSSDDGSELVAICKCLRWEAATSSYKKAEFEHQYHLAQVLEKKNGGNSMTNVASAGWYPDPTKANTQRYWDGGQWTNHFAPMAPPQARPVHYEDDYANMGVLATGYVFAVLLPIVGFIIGLTQINRRGSGVVILSVVSFIGWFILWSQ